MRMTDALSRWIATSDRARATASRYIARAYAQRNAAPAIAGNLDDVLTSTLTDAAMSAAEERGKNPSHTWGRTANRCLLLAAVNHVRIELRERLAIATSADLDEHIDTSWQSELIDEQTAQRQQRIADLYSRCNERQAKTLSALETELRAHPDGKRRKRRDWEHVTARLVSGRELALRLKAGEATGRRRLAELRAALSYAPYLNSLRSVLAITGNPLDRLRSARACFAVRSTLTLRGDLPSQTCTQEQHRRRERAIQLAQYKRMFFSRSRKK